MKKIITNYHTHTFRCGHANIESDENYVLEAIKYNYKILGFSDHAALKGITHLGMRMDFSLIDDYISSINNLKTKYKDKIKIYLGFEIEYIPFLINYYKELKNKYHFDYLILGQHLTYTKDGNQIFYFNGINDINGIIRYKNDLIEGIKTGLFSYICHPDLFMNYVSKINDDIDKAIEEICIEAKKYNIPLEININGEINNKMSAISRNCFHYPSPYFFKKAKEIGNKFIFGIDAHSSDMFSRIDYSFIETFLKETDIKEEDIINKLF